MSDRKALHRYLALVFAASILVSVVSALTGGPDSRYNLALGLFVMWAPALSVLIACKSSGERAGDFGWRRLPWLLLLCGLFTLPLVAHVLGLTTLQLVLGEIPWQSWLTPGSDGLFHPPKAVKFGTEGLTGGALAGKLVVKALFGLLLLSLFALGEEIGWRGFMQPRLVKRYGLVRGVVIAAGIWALWHTPYALSGIHHIPGMAKWQVALLLPVGHLGYGLFLGWLWQRSASIWIVVLAHAATNNWAGIAFKYIDADQHAWLLLLANSIGYLAIGLFCLQRLSRDPCPFAELTEP